MGRRMNLSKKLSGRRAGGRADWAVKTISKSADQQSAAVRMERESRVPGTTEPVFLQPPRAMLVQIHPCQGVPWDEEEKDLAKVFSLGRSGNHNNRDLHLEAVGNPRNLKALDLKVYPNSGLVISVKNILAQPVGGKEVIRGPLT